MNITARQAKVMTQDIQSHMTNARSALVARYCEKIEADIRAAISRGDYCCNSRAFSTKLMRAYALTEYDLHRKVSSKVRAGVYLVRDVVKVLRDHGFAAYEMNKTTSWGIFDIHEKVLHISWEIERPENLNSA